MRTRTTVAVIAALAAVPFASYYAFQLAFDRPAEPASPAKAVESVKATAPQPAESHASPAATPGLTADQRRAWDRYRAESAGEPVIILVYVTREPVRGAPDDGAGRWAVYSIAETPCWGLRPGLGCGRPNAAEAEQEALGLAEQPRVTATAVVDAFSRADPVVLFWAYGPGNRAARTDKPHSPKLAAELAEFLARFQRDF